MAARLGRREFLGLAAGVTTATVATATGAVWAKGLRVTDGPYGPLQGPDAHGLMLPEGFEARVVAHYDRPVGSSSYRWHIFPDGGAVFPADDEGWVYVSNSEAREEGTGGAGAIRFDAEGAIVDAYSILSGTMVNCAGGATPWGTWLSGEEHEQGRVWECDPMGEADAVPLPALGVFLHEASAVDPDLEQVYLTEDAADGRWYRFTPDSYPDLGSGVLEVAQVDEAGRVRWLPLPDPSARDLATRSQVAESTAFLGGEGIWYREGVVYFVTKLDQKVWMYSTVDETLSVLYEPALVPEPPLLTGPDNIVMSSFGDLLVCEDHTGEQEIVLITADGEIAPLLRLTGQNAAELTGPAFSPGGDRLYFSSQRGGDGGGITYEVRGPFRHTEPVTTTSASAATTTPTTIADALSRNEQRRTEETEPGGGDDDFPVVPAVGGAVVAAGLLAGGIALARRRASSRSEDEPGTS